VSENLLAETSLPDGRSLKIAQATPADAPALLQIIQDAFRNRPPVHPTPAALLETVDSIAEAVDSGFAVMALVADVPCGAIIVSLDDQTAGIHRVSVHPDLRRQGVASLMIEVVLELLAANGVAEVRLVAREEFPQVVSWWQRRGFSAYGQDSPHVYLSRQVALRYEIPTADDMRAFGQRLAGLLRPGDLLIASGELGAGKTTLAQGIGSGLEVSGPVISPTFVLSRIHPALGTRPGLLHVDAYRLDSWEELADLDLQTEGMVTLVEWGAGLAEGLSEDRLEIDIRLALESTNQPTADQPATDSLDETRLLFLTLIGERWTKVRAQLETLWN
jgi:tRNA threonylcarbamoyladenosine biosynthesis protein TsaE